MITVKDVARMFRLDYDLVYRIDFKVLEAIVKVYESPNPPGVYFPIPLFSATLAGFTNSLFVLLSRRENSVSTEACQCDVA